MRWADMRIMWSDDTPIETEAGVAVLRNLGVDVERAKTAEGAYSLLATGRLFDLVILDVRLPSQGALPAELAAIKASCGISVDSELNGLVIARWLQTSPRLAPYIFYTMVGESRHRYSRKLANLVDPEGSRFFGKQERAYWGEGVKTLVKQALGLKDVH